MIGRLQRRLLYSDVAQRYPGPDANRANKQKLGSQYGPLKERRPFQIEGLEESAFLG